jgi:MFS family permease
MDGFLMIINKKKFETIFTIFIFVALASLDNAVIGLFPPLFSSIARDLNIHVSSLGVVSAVNFFITSFSSIFWGYLADKGRRKRLIIIGTLIWSVSVFLTAYSKSYVELIIYQVFTGIGLGCIGSIGFSVLTDYIPRKWRGMLMSLWGMSQGFGGIAGSVMASIVATSSNWRRPFEIISILGLSFIFLYFFIKEPKKGAAEPELQELVEGGYDYDYSIEFSHIYDIIAKRSNLWLILQGFFMNITTGTLIWLPTLYASKIEVLGFRPETAVIASGFLFALLQVGGLASMYFGYLGDRLQRQTPRGRALLGGIAVFAALPLYVFMFTVPMNNLIIPDTSDSIHILTALLKQILTNPWMSLMFILAIGATAAQSANMPNWLAILTDVNLPEHRATAFSIANLIGGAGRAFGNIMIGVVLANTTKYFPEPNNYIFTLGIFQLFFIPSVFCYIKIAVHSSSDIKLIKSILKRRARTK